MLAEGELFVQYTVILGITVGWLLDSALHIYVCGKVACFVVLKLQNDWKNLDV